MPSIPRYYSDNVTQRSTFNMSSIFQYYSTFSFAHSFSIASKMETFTGIVLNIYFFDMDTPAYILRHFLWWRFSRVFDRFLNDFHIFRFGFYPHFKYLLRWIDFILFHFVGSDISFKYCYIFFLFAFVSLRWAISPIQFLSNCWITLFKCALAHGKQVIEIFK